jgi:hypothetical protein
VCAYSLIGVVDVEAVVVVVVGVVTVAVPVPDLNEGGGGGVGESGGNGGGAWSVVVRANVIGGGAQGVRVYDRWVCPCARVLN